jgi:hypothetical protein
MPLTTKLFIQKLRDKEWEPLLNTVKSFCEKCEIDVPDMNAHYTKAAGGSRHQDEEYSITMKHYFRIDVSCNRLPITITK